MLQCKRVDFNENDFFSEVKNVNIDFCCQFNAENRKFKHFKLLLLVILSLISTMYIRQRSSNQRKIENLEAILLMIIS